MTDYLDDFDRRLNANVPRAAQRTVRTVFLKSVMMPERKMSCRRKRRQHCERCTTSGWISIVAEWLKVKFVFH